MSHSETVVAERFLDAAEACYARYGLAKTSMDDVGREAGASRATLYRHFKSRDELLLAALTREARLVATEAAAYLGKNFDSVDAYLVEGLLFCLRELPKRPLLGTLFTRDGLGNTSRIVLTSEEMLAIGVAVLRPMFEPAQQQGLLRDNVRIEVIIEWILHLLASYLLAPSRVATTEDQMRDLLNAMLLPAVLAPRVLAPRVLAPGTTPRKTTKPRKKTTPRKRTKE
jgi:AcrR family transcriptional regulator